MKLINSFHGATCPSNLLRAKAALEKSKLRAFDQLKPQRTKKFLVKPKKLNSNFVPELAPPTSEIGGLPLSNRGVTTLPTGFTHGVPGVDSLMTKHPTTRKGDWWIGRFPLKRP